VPADEGAPGPARRGRDADALEAIAEAVARAAGARPRLGGGDRAPAAARAGQVHGPRHGLPVQPDAPVVAALAHLEHGDAQALAGAHARLELVVGRRRARPGHLVVERALGAGEGAQAHLDPGVGAVRALTDPADADPGGDVAGRDLRLRERGQRGADAVGAGRAEPAGVRVPVRARARLRRRSRSGRGRGGERQREQGEQAERTRAEGHLPGSSGGLRRGAIAGSGYPVRGAASGEAPPELVLHNLPRREPLGVDFVTGYLGRRLDGLLQ
jgi:hypothetical protein